MRGVEIRISCRKKEQKIPDTIDGTNTNCTDHNKYLDIWLRLIRFESPALGARTRRCVLKNCLTDDWHDEVLLAQDVAFTWQECACNPENNIFDMQNI